MANTRTFQKKDPRTGKTRTRSTTVPATAVQLIHNGWREVTSTPAGKGGPAGDQPAAAEKATAQGARVRKDG